jgi:serine O-acetyltransferase
MQDPTVAPSPLRKFILAVRADFASVQKNRARYHGEQVPMTALPHSLVRKIGFQMTTAIRCMHLARDLRLPLVPQVLCRAIRHVYGAEVHWNAEIAPGISIVHGNGLVISHAARVSEGCILFHNATLGEGLDPVSRTLGGPHLEPNVHVGPGAQVIGPITIGAGSKIGAGAIVTQSVPPNSVVIAPAPTVSSRPPKSGHLGPVTRHAEQGASPHDFPGMTGR